MNTIRKASYYGAYVIFTLLFAVVGIVAWVVNSVLRWKNTRSGQISKPRVRLEPATRPASVSFSPDHYRPLS